MSAVYVVILLLVAIGLIFALCIGDESDEQLEQLIRKIKNDPEDHNDSEY